MSATAPWILQRHQLSFTDYHRMAQAGILGEDDRCELINGEIIDRAPIGSEHASTVKRLLRRFEHAVGNSTIVSIQDPVRLDAHNEPSLTLHCSATGTISTCKRTRRRKTCR